MIKVFRVIVTITLVLFYSCNNGIIHEEKAVEKSETELVLERISAMGFDTEGYQIIGNNILVEGDIAFNIDVIISDSSRQYYKSDRRFPGGRLVSANKVANIKVYSSLDSSWDSIIRSAINEFNSVPNTKIRLFFEDYYGNPYNLNDCDIHIYYDPNGFPKYNTVGYAPYPSNFGDPGSYININHGLLASLNYNFYQKKKAIMHELGHCLGFAHQVSTGTSESETSYVPGTPMHGSDKRSIMAQGGYYDYFYYSDPKFTDGDKKMMQTLYPHTENTPYIDAFEHTAFRGRNYRLYESTTWLPYNDTLSSIKLYNGAHIWVYEHGRYNGKRYGYYTPTVDYIYNLSFNDRASSIQFSAWQEVGEVILNKTFSNSGDWDQSSLYHYRTPDKLYTSNFKITDKCEAFVSNGVLHTYISDRGSKPEDIYFKTTDLLFDRRFTYDVSFKARTEKGQSRYIKVAIGEGLMANSFEMNVYKITEDFSTFSFSFRPDSYTSNGTLMFYMGDMPKDTWAKDVVLDDIKITRSR